jgi:hypothetical protein
MVQREISNCSGIRKYGHFNGLFGWSYKLVAETVKTSDSELERVPQIEPASCKIDCSSKLMQKGHQKENFLGGQQLIRKGIILG